MKPSESHPFFSFFVDAWALSSVLRFVWFMLPLRDDAKVIGFVAAVVIGVSIPAIYHATDSWRRTTLTPGEIAAGAAIVNGEKAWLNPYSMSRSALFVCFYALLYVNVEEPFSAGTLWSGSVALLTVMTMLACLVLVGRGHAWALLGPILYRSATIVRDLAAAPDLTLVYFLEHCAGDAAFVFLCLLVMLKYVRSSSVAPVPSTSLPPAAA